MSDELTMEKKLALAERANEIFRQQLKYMQDHLASLRALIQDKENIIENLILRYDLGIISEDQQYSGSSESQMPDLTDFDDKTRFLFKKSWGLLRASILENFTLREMVNELRDENFHLRNEIYELVESPYLPFFFLYLIHICIIVPFHTQQSKINRQVLQINKLESQKRQIANTYNAHNKDMNTDQPNDTAENELDFGDGIPRYLYQDNESEDIQ